ncbi:hypothetical protein SCLCIDRAFT_48933, partial [Scleroderma citrinum Foug A]
ELIIEAWRDYFTVLKHDLTNSLGQISLTADIWTDENRRPFLVTTAHWIASDENSATFRLKVALIAFHYFPGSHTG